jgi:hypothetical protein
MSKSNSPFGQFLMKNSVFDGGELPLVHSTQAYHLRSLQSNGTLVASECDVFVGEKLNYFFVGRPAYKNATEESESAYWEFPCCFIFEFHAIGDVRRIFPFDSGAFNRNLYPSYMRMMKSEAFEVASVANAPGRIIGAFFGTPSRYFEMKPVGEDAFNADHLLKPMDMEVRAILRLSFERSSSNFDDRRLTIEVQSGSDVDLTVSQPLAVIAPSEFYEDATFRSHVENVWKAMPISYPISSLNVTTAYGQIYDKVREFYKGRGLL